MLLKTLILLSLLFASTLAGSCEDDDDFYWFNNFNGKEFELSCSFISNPNNPTVREKRQNNWCNRTVRGYLVKKKCPKACDRCDDDDEDEGDDRSDNECYDYPSNWKDSEGRRCSWYEKSSGGKGSKKTRCKDAKYYKNKGKTAEDVCCECGGGKDSAFGIDADATASA